MSKEAKMAIPGLTNVDGDSHAAIVLLSPETQKVVHAMTLKASTDEGAAMLTSWCYCLATSRGEEAVKQLIFSIADSGVAEASGEAVSVDELRTATIPDGVLDITFVDGFTARIHSNGTVDEFVQGMVPALLNPGAMTNVLGNACAALAADGFPDMHDYYFVTADEQEAEQEVDPVSAILEGIQGVANGIAAGVKGYVEEGGTPEDLQEVFGVSKAEAQELHDGLHAIIEESEAKQD